MAQADLRAVKRARQKLDAAERNLHAMIVAAYQSGEVLRDIAPWAGLSFQRIHQIVRKHENHEKGLGRPDSDRGPTEPGSA